MEKVIIENMDGVLICEVPINAVLENDSKKIKLSTEKLANVLSKALLPKENIKIEEPIHEEIDDNLKNNQLRLNLFIKNHSKKHQL